MRGGRSAGWHTADEIVGIPSASLGAGSSTRSARFAYLSSLRTTMLKTTMLRTTILKSLATLVLGLLVLGESTMDEIDGDGALADGGGYALDVPGADVADGED